jgi:hypothetical protein
MYIHPVTSTCAATAITFTTVRFACSTTSTSHFYCIKRLKNNKGKIEKRGFGNQHSVTIMAVVASHTCTEVDLLGFYHLGIKALFVFLINYF